VVSGAAAVSGAAVVAAAVVGAAALVSAAAAVVAVSDPPSLPQAEVSNDRTPTTASAFNFMVFPL
jgi:hypothetical protein